jgi:hypothetical protein
VKYHQLVPKAALRLTDPAYGGQGFAPAKYVDDHTLLDYRIDFCQLPYEIYRIQR